MSGVGCRVARVGSRAAGVGSRVAGRPYRVAGRWCRVAGVGCRVSGRPCRVASRGCRVSGRGPLVSGVGSREVHPWLRLPTIPQYLDREGAVRLPDSSPSPGVLVLRSGACRPLPRGRGTVGDRRRGGRVAEVGSRRLGRRGRVAGDPPVTQAPDDTAVPRPRGSGPTGRRPYPLISLTLHVHEERARSLAVAEASKRHRATPSAKRPCDRWARRPGMGRGPASTKPRGLSQAARG